MDDWIQQEALSTFICEECQQNDDYHFRDKMNHAECWYCPHSEVFLNMEYTKPLGGYIRFPVPEGLFRTLVKRGKVKEEKLQAMNN